MAAVQKIKGSAPKVRNRNRTKGYWVMLSSSRSNRQRDLPNRNSRQGINYPVLGEVGSAAYRRMKGKG